VGGRYRWWIGGLLFASTVINYLDRQTLSVLAPHLKDEFHWSNQDFALIVIIATAGRKDLTQYVRFEHCNVNPTFCQFSVQ